MRRTSQLVGLDFSTGRAISRAPGHGQCRKGVIDFHDLSRAPTDAQVELAATRVHICAFAKLLLPAWEDGRRLKTNNLCVHRVHFLPCEHAQFPVSRFVCLLMWHKCGTDQQTKVADPRPRRTTPQQLRPSEIFSKLRSNHEWRGFFFQCSDQIAESTDNSLAPF